MRIIYSILLYSLTPFLLLRLLWKSRRLKNYRYRIYERFALRMPASPKIDIWLHAVSVGETIAAIPLIETLLSHNKKLLITTTTATGSEQVTKLLGTRVSHQYLPYDLTSILKRFLKHYQPKLVIIMETEIWPNLVYTVTNQHIPLILANARLSEQSYKHYRYLRYFLKPILQKFTAICAQSADDQARYIALGAKQNQVSVLGNMKFDLTKTQIHSELGMLKTYWGNTRPVFICASTHEGEEAIILSILATLQAQIPNLLLLIAPRHPERFKFVYELCQRRDFKVALRSQINQTQDHLDIIIIDSMGELQSLFELCDFAFVGGSFIAIGGHNILEPIASNVPVLIGPYFQNFKHIIQTLMNAGGISIVANAQQLCEQLIQLHQNKETREKQINQAKQVLVENRGALSKHLELIHQLKTI